MKGRKSYIRMVLTAVVLLAAAGLMQRSAFSQVAASWNDAQGTWDTSADWNCPTTATHCVPNNNGATTFNVTINTGNGEVNLFSSPLARRYHQFALNREQR